MVIIEDVGVEMGFKEHLRQLREERGWTQTEAAKRAGTTFRSYQNWESPGAGEPRAGALLKLAAAFNVTVDELLTGKGPKKRKAR